MRGSPVLALALAGARDRQGELLSTFDVGGFVRHDLRPAARGFAEPLELESAP